MGFCFFLCVFLFDTTYFHQVNTSQKAWSSKHFLFCGGLQKFHLRRNALKETVSLSSSGKKKKKAKIFNQKVHLSFGLSFHKI